MKIIEFLKRPKGWVLALTYLLTLLLGGLAILFAVLGQNDPLLEILSYPVYGLAAIVLAYAVYTVVIYWKKMKDGVINAINSVTLGKRMLDQYGFRTVVFAFLSLLLNIAYSLFNGVLGIVTRSIWYGSLAGYYIILTVLRSVLVSYHKNRAKTDDKVKQKIYDLKKFKFVGILLTVLPFFLSFAILEMVTSGAAFVYYDWTVYAFAAFAFYKVFMAVKNIFEARRSEDVTILALRNIGLADAMVTILALQTSLLYSFGDGNNSIANILTGAAVCLGTLVIGVYMIIASSRKLRSMSEENQ